MSTRSEDLAAAQGAAAKVVEALDGAVIGQRAAAELLLAAYVAGGHALIEGVPGIAKTLLARSFAALLGMRFMRVQFTPDLMPSDLVGGNVFDQKSAAFRLVRGPIFTEILMADEINRTPPKTQSALLEAMQEGQVTIDGASLALDPAFFVIATQNPIEFEGTYPLPEAQLDRFVARVAMRRPDRAAEVEIYRRAVDGTLPAFGWGGSLPGPRVEREAATGLRGAARFVHVAPELLDYVATLAEAVRGSDRVEMGVSPRGALALLAMARAVALVRGRDFVTPDDLKLCLEPCWAHRTLLTAEAELEGRAAAKVLEDIAAAVPVPR
jgi:MoxR-like ATPase